MTNTALATPDMREAFPSHLELLSDPEFMAEYNAILDEERATEILGTATPMDDDLRDSLEALHTYEDGPRAYTTHETHHV